MNFMYIVHEEIVSGYEQNSIINYDGRWKSLCSTQLQNLKSQNKPIDKIVKFFLQASRLRCTGHSWDPSVCRASWLLDQSPVCREGRRVGWHSHRCVWESK